MDRVFAIKRVEKEITRTATVWVIEAQNGDSSGTLERNTNIKAILSCHRQNPSDKLILELPDERITLMRNNINNRWEMLAHRTQKLSSHSSFNNATKALRIGKYLTGIEKFNIIIPDGEKK